MSGLDSEIGSKMVPDERSGEQSQSDMPDIKDKDEFPDADPNKVPQAKGEPTLPGSQEPTED